MNKSIANQMSDKLIPINQQKRALKVLISLFQYPPRCLDVLARPTHLDLHLVMQICITNS